MAIRRPPTTFSDTISTADIADDAITGGKLANDIAISTTGNIVTTGSGALTVAGNTTLSGTNNLGSNPTITLGSNATISKSGMLQGKSKNYTSSSNVNVQGQSTVISSNLDLTLTNCTAGSHFICGFNSAMYNNGGGDDVEFDVITNIAGGSNVIYPGGSAPPYGAMGTTRIQTDWTHRAQFLVLDSLGHSTGNSVRFRMQYLNRSSSSNTCTVCHANAMLSFYVLEII